MLEPVNSGKRYVILEPTSMENADVDVWVNGKKQLKSDLDDPKRQLFKHFCRTEFNGFLNIKIVVNSGVVSIGQKDAYGVYPVTYDYVPNGLMVEGLMRFRQESRLHWIHEPSIEREGDSNFFLKEGDEFTYKHLIANTPDWFRVYFHQEKHKEQFLKNGILTEKMVQESVLIPVTDHFVKDYNADIDTRTNNLIRDSGA